MPRRRRSFHPGLYHLAPRASDTRYLFENEGERRSFLAELARTLDRYEIALVAYTLMGTHYHLVVDSPGAGIAAALQRLHTWYARMANSARERAAHLFRAHYFAREITSEEDFLTVCHYVAHNPVEAGLVREPFAWPWSSAAATAGLARPQVPLELEPIRLAFGSRPNWQRRYQAFIAASWHERSDG
jgi:REP element-mobilizing transposase RayT